MDQVRDPDKLFVTRDGRIGWVRKGQRPLKGPRDHPSLGQGGERAHQPAREANISRYQTWLRD
jgi:hypothetical protein